MDLKKEENPQCFDEYHIQMIPSHNEYKWRAQVYLTFAPHDSEQYKKTIENGENLLRSKLIFCDIFKCVHGVAYAEDFLFLSDQLMMALCFKNIKYEDGAVYKAHITRFLKGQFIDLRSIQLSNFQLPN